VGKHNSLQGWNVSNRIGRRALRVGLNNRYLMMIESNISSTPPLKFPANIGGTDRTREVVATRNWLSLGILYVALKLADLKKKKRKDFTT
jgi:hypothetical protein